MLGIDPWLIDPLFGVCGKINFQERAGEECLASNVSFLLDKIKAKYAEYGIEEKPFVIVKADAGTYGMGIMTVHDASEVTGLNRKQRNKMAVVKEGLEVSSVIVQEGVPTFESIHDAIAEPVVYMIDRFVVGGFYRVHAAARQGRKPECPGRAVRAARVRIAVHSRLERPARLPAQPLLRVRRRRPARAARGGDRSRGARGRRGSRSRLMPAPRGASESAMITPEYCQLMARYNRWMNERLYALVGGIPGRGAQARPRRVLRLDARHAQSSPLGRSDVARPLHRRAVHGAGVRRRHVRRISRSSPASAKSTDRKMLDWAGNTTASWLAGHAALHEQGRRPHARALARARRDASLQPRNAPPRPAHDAAEAGGARSRAHRPAVAAGRRADHRPP